MNFKSILALDPGITTGYAFATNGTLVDFGHATGIEEIYFKFNQLLEGYSPTPKAVVYEGFSRGNSVVKEQIITIEACGAIQALGISLGVPVAMQFPSVRTGYIPIAKTMVSSFGRGGISKNRHAIDAIAHLLAFFDKEGIDWKKQYWMSLAFPPVD